MADGVSFFGHGGRIRQLFRRFKGYGVMVQKGEFNAAETAAAMGVPIGAGLKNRCGQAVGSVKQKDFLKGDPVLGGFVVKTGSRYGLNGQDFGIVFTKEERVPPDFQGIGRMGHIGTAGGEH